MTQPDPILRLVPRTRSDSADRPPQPASEPDGERADTLDSGPIDAVTFPALLERYWDPLSRYAERMLSDADAADDIVQEAFTRLWKRRESWMPGGSVRSYMYGLVRNLLIDEVRTRQRRLKLLDARRTEVTPRAQTPGEVAESEALAAAVEAAIQALPERRREVFTLAHLQDFSYKQIAEIMGVSTNTISNHMTLALQDLRAALAAFLPD